MLEVALSNLPPSSLEQLLSSYIRVVLRGSSFALFLNMVNPILHSFVDFTVYF